MSQELTAIIAKVNSDSEREFKAEFLQIKDGLTDAIERAFPEDSVRIVETSDLEVYTKLIFVLQKVFTAKFMPPETLKIPVVTLPGVGGSDDKMVGVLFRPYGFPKQIPHFIVKLKASRSFGLRRSILDSKDIRRLGQARETWNVRCRKEIANRPKEMKVGRSAHSYDYVRGVWEQAEDARKQKEAERGAQQMSTDQARAAGKSVHAVRRVVRGSMDDEEADYGGAIAKGKGKAKAKVIARRGAAAKLAIARQRSAASGSQVVSDAGTATGPAGIPDIIAHGSCLVNRFRSRW